MSLTIANVGGTQTGGSSVVATAAGLAPGKSVYVLLSHSRLFVRQIEFTNGGGSTNGTGKGSNGLGSARAGVKITLAERSVEEGCCTVKAGAVIFDIGMRMDLAQAENLAEAYSYLKAIFHNASVEALFTNGTLPSN